MKLLSQVKKDIEFNSGLHSLIDVLKTIAVSEFHLLERKLQTFERLGQTLESFFKFIDIKYLQHPLVNPSSDVAAIVAITSEKGLLGGLNNQVMLAALNQLNKTNGRMVIIGERGELFVREHNIPAVVFPGIYDTERYSQAVQLRDYLFNKVLAGEVGTVKIVYPRAISFTLQRVEIEELLPYGSSVSKIDETQLDIWRNTIWESQPEDVLEYLVYLLMAQKIYEIFGLSRLAELAARFVHLEESSQKLERFNETLRLEYFRIRHELVDRNMRELFAASSLFKNAE